MTSLSIYIATGDPHFTTWQKINMLCI